jgi:hypothetical protein
MIGSFSTFGSLSNVVSLQLILSSPVLVARTPECQRAERLVSQQYLHADMALKEQALAPSLDYLTELQKHAGELAARPQDWMPWDYRQSLHRPDLQKSGA